MDALEPLANDAKKSDYRFKAGDYNARQHRFIRLTPQARHIEYDMMKNWNKTGKIKAIILGILALPNLLMPIADPGSQGFAMVLMPFVFGSLAIPLVAKFNETVFARELAAPAWNDNPLTLKRPLGFFHFGSFFFLTIGLSIIIGTAIKFQILSLLGLMTVSFGLGILMGIWLTLRWKKARA